MARYEVVVRSTVQFGRDDARFGDDARAEQVVIRFEGLSFVWHSNDDLANDASLDWPSVTVVVADGNDYSREMLITNRFLSALSFLFDAPMMPDVAGASGFASELDRAIFRADGRPRVGMRIPAPQEIVVSPDDRLRLTLALFREGRGSDSPFYRFLALFNALDAAFDNDEPARDEYIRNQLKDEVLPEDVSRDSFDWAHYLRESVRNAVAHAVRHSGRPMLDPDLPTDRSRLARDSESIARLVRARVGERWPSGVKMTR